jgi:Na+/proline symporter
VLAVFGVVFTLFGGLNAVIWSDLVQVVLYVGAALLAFFFLISLIPADTGTILSALSDSGKLTLIDTSTDLSKPFTLAAILTGMVLLNIGNAGLDQDTTQRFLSCEDAKSGQRALILSAVAAIPVVALFMAIGSLLHIFYERPDLMGVGAQGVSASFAGEKITVFMAFILSEIPPGLRGLVTVGVIAAAAINSGLISMSAVLVKDFWRPLLERAGKAPSGLVEVRAGRLAVVILAVALFGVSLLCYYWQHYADTPLLDFVLGVMTFAYSGLLGVFGVALFTRRGNSTSVVAALVAGFVAVLAQQHYVVDALGLPSGWKLLSFPWQLCIGTAIAFLVCLIGKPVRRD